jgi:hypothetical protein
METKTAQAISLFNSGNMVGALKLFSGFRIGFSKEEQRTLQIAYESHIGKEEFYKSIAVDTDTIKAQAISIIKIKYNV